MKIVTLGEAGRELPGVVVDEGNYVDVSDVVAVVDGPFLADGGLERLGPVVAERVADGRVRPLPDSRRGAPIGRPHQILCIGLNYRDHAEETGQAVPDEPILFTKAPNTLIGPDDDVVLPRGSRKTDWEVELGVVIGRRLSYATSEAEAMAAVAGYVVVNDVSEREFQLERGGQWSKGKSCATFNPCGPYLVTLEEIDDVGGLDLWLDVNGRPMQRGSTATMVFGVPYLVHYLSQFTVLEPGDLINTGTPPGVGMGMTPPQYLEAGDVMDLGIDGLGRQRQRVVADPLGRS